MTYVYCDYALRQQPIAIELLAGFEAHVEGLCGYCDNTGVSHNRISAKGFATTPQKPEIAIAH